MLPANPEPLLPHGGQLRAAAKKYAIDIAEWLDLSTGINPNGWPVPMPPADVWSRLPEEEDGLVAAAQAYYGTQQLLPLAGSQAAIQLLPRLRPAASVALLAPSYAEHAAAWRGCGHRVLALEESRVEQAVDQVDVLLLVSPNNPTGVCFSPAQLLQWHARLATRGGWLIVDEAFMDATPEQSLTGHCGVPGLIVLRSLGKFFGLAGARVGFVAAWPELLQQMQRLLGPWSVNHPARWLTIRALADHAWQLQAREALAGQAARLSQLLNRYGLTPHGGCVLFQWVSTAHAERIHDHFARRAILLRRFNEPESLRFGLPPDEAAWQRLQQALQTLELG